MSKKIYQRKDAFGNPYWEDENGHQTYQRKDAFGKLYWEDENGHQTYQREDLFGNTYQEDQNGNQTYQRKDAFGNTYQEDQNGNQTYQRKDAFGNTYWEGDGVPILEEEEKRFEKRKSEYSYPKPNEDNFLWWLIGVPIALIVIFMIGLAIGVPIAGGYFSAKFTNYKYLSQKQNKKLWQFTALPPAFILGLLLTSEVVGFIFWGLYCLAPNSSFCRNYPKDPYPALLHPTLVRMLTGQSLSNNSQPTTNNQNNSSSSPQNNSSVTGNQTVTSTSQSLPEEIVMNYYSFLNQGDYAQAWNLLPSNLKNNKNVHPDGYNSFATWYGQITPITITAINLIENNDVNAVVDVNTQYRLNSQSMNEKLRYSLRWNDQQQTWNFESIKLR
jgi:hypothetical protein